MPARFTFDPEILHSVAGGRSAIEIPRLNLQTLDEADAFLRAYGFNYSDPKVVDRLWYFHRRALVLLVERLGFGEFEIPEGLRERRLLGDLRQLLLRASSRREEDRFMQRWSCAILRCMHVFVHAETDLFSTFPQEIQSQILTPLQEAIVHDGTDHKTYLRSRQEGGEQIELVAFEQKPFKTSQSTVIKLLARPDALAMKVFDKLGVRFVTRNLYDTFRVIRFLIEENLIGFPHIMPDQSSNNLYPVDLFITVSRELAAGPRRPEAEMEALFARRLTEAGEAAKMLRKANEQTSADFRFIKFITRKLIEVPVEGRDPIHFFYPFEIQIMDEKARQQMQSGPSDHDSYKDRQREAARRRVFPETEKA